MLCLAFSPGRLGKNWPFWILTVRIFLKKLNPASYQLLQLITTWSLATNLLCELVHSCKQTTEVVFFRQSIHSWFCTRTYMVADDETSMMFTCFFCWRQLVDVFVKQLFSLWSFGNRLSSSFFLQEELLALPADDGMTRWGDSTMHCKLGWWKDHRRSFEDAEFGQNERCKPNIQRSWTIRKTFSFTYYWNHMEILGNIFAWKIWRDRLKVSHPKRESHGMIFARFVIVEGWYSILSKQVFEYF